MSELVAVLDEREVGRLRQVRGRLSFRYAESWRLANGAYPLSLSMPLTQAEHPHAPVEAFLWGLLPDNDVVLRRWGRLFGVSDRNPFALIGEVGEDCAGAVQFVSEDRLHDDRTGTVAWLTEGDVAERLRRLRDDASTGRLAGDVGQFSLAGAQPKTALLFYGQRWGVPSGRIPTTHILKPALSNFDGHVENEHVCLNLARAFGFPAARSEARMFGDQQAIVVERYDRVGTNPIRRAHQEDLCQALGVHPSRKYQADGGPGPVRIVGLLRSAVSPNVAREDIATFRDALILNWLIGGTDAHAKNYSLLLGRAGIVRLAPLYDVASVLVYSGIDPLKVRMAMSIGGEYRLERISLPQWRRLATTCRLDGDALIVRIAEMAAALPDLLSDEVRRARAIGLNHPVLDRMTEVLTARARRIEPLAAGG